MGVLGQQDLNSGVENVRRFGPRVPSNTAPNGQVTGDLWYDISELNLKAWNGTIWQTIGGSFTIQPPARVGPSPVGAHGSGYASFDHTGRSYNTPNHYVLLADVTNTFVNAPTGGNVFLRIENSDRVAVSGGGVITYGAAAAEVMVADTNTVRSNYGFTMPHTTVFYLRGFGDTNHIITVPTIASYGNSTFTVDGPVLKGFAGPMFVNQGQWRMYMFTDGHIGVQGKMSIGTFGSQDAFADGESLTTAGGLSGFSLRQRARGNSDATNRCVIYPGDNGGGVGGEGLFLWQNGNMVHFSQGQNVHVTMGLPNVGVQLPMMYVGANGQIGVNTSSGLHKDNIRALKETTDLDSDVNNPVFKMRPVRFTWKQREFVGGDGVINAEEINKLHPNGYAGLIAEEVRKVASDAVIVIPAQPEWRYDPEVDPKPSMGEDGEPLIYRPATDEKIAGIDNDRMVAYLIDAVQYLKEEIDRLKKKK